MLQNDLLSSEIVASKFEVWKGLATLPHWLHGT